MRIDWCVVCSQRRHWKAGHKQECAAATQKQPVAVTDTSELRESECPVCLDEFEQPVKLPCSHAMCCGCLKQLRESNVGTACPMCRAKLPPGPQVLFEDGCTVRVRAERAAAGPVRQRLEQRAVELCRAAAAQGHAGAQYNLGACYQRGEGVEQNMQRAVELYQAAAAQGVAQAQCYLGVCYERGEGVRQSMSRAVEMYRAAAAQGRAEAQFALAECYYEGEGVEQSMSRAVELYQSAAAQGLAEAQFALAECYHEGKGVEQSMQRAVEMFQAAAAQGHTQARASLEHLAQAQQSNY